MNLFNNQQWLRRTVWCLAAVLALWGLLWLAVPPLLRSQGQKWASEALGREVRIGRVEFAPWAMRLVLHELSVAKADGRGQQFAVQRVFADVGLVSWLHLAPVLDALEIDQPMLHLVQTSPGHYDIDDIVARLAQPAEPSQAGSPARFALYNIAVRGGAVDFEDRTVERTHTVRGVELRVPFLSSLPSKREIKVEPRLAFQLNGSDFDSSAQTTPFLSSRKTDAHIRLADFDVGPYLGYLPESLPVRLQAGVLDLDLMLSFEQAPASAVHLRGSAQAKGVRVADRYLQPLVEVQKIALDIADLQPLARRAHIAAVEVHAPQVFAQRQANGLVNWQRVLTPGGDAPAKPAQAAEPAVSATQQAQELHWQLALDQVTVREGQVQWQDEAVSGGATLALQALQFDATAIALPQTKPVPFSGSAQLQGAALDFQGEAHASQSSVQASLRGLSLDAGAPYLAEHWLPRLAGQLDADLALEWKGSETVAHLKSLTVRDLAMTCPPRTACAGKGLPGIAMRSSDSLAEIKVLRVENARLDALRQSLTVEHVSVTQPRTVVARSKEGHWMTEQWQVGRPAVPTPTPSPTGQALASPPTPWSVLLRAIEVDGGAVALHDAYLVRPVSLSVSGLRVRIEDLAPLAAPGGKPAQLQLAAHIGAGQAHPGRLEYEGSVGLAPLNAEGQVLATHLPLHAMEPYVAEALNVRVLRADGSFKGRLQYAQQPSGPVAKVQGDLSLDELRVRSQLLTQTKAAATDPDSEQAPQQAGQDDLLRWKSLGMRGVDVVLSPGQATKIQVRETALSDFFARVIVQESGRINLQGLLKAAPEAESAQHAPTQADSPTAPVVAAKPEALGPLVYFGPVSLVGGAVHFSDYFIKPNYSANLSALTGRLSAFSSEPPAAGEPVAMADLELRGRAEGTAALEITGKLNPLAQPLALDIVGKMRDLELPPLSPYTIKYAGHGIERGKLSMEVAYKIQPDGQLSATNKLTLNQLTFGEPVEGAPASLPVRLATALLADRNGVIDLDLPISGSLNDPEFRLAPVIFKIIGNLIMKAVTAPFALLTNALGGASDLSQVDFAPGSAQLDETARAALDKLAKALLDRPGLTMTVVGQAQASSEREGWKQAQLQAMLLAQKRSAAQRQGQDAAAVDSVTDEEAPALLKEVYRRADIPKPRNLVGLAKDVPTAEMQALLLANIAVPENAMHELAVARGVAVRDYLVQHQLPQDRLILGAVNASPDGEKWTPHALLTLAMP